MGYYLTIGIYPKWATFVKPILMPKGSKRSLFAKFHSTVRKDVDRAFGVLQSRFAIISGLARPWHGHVVKDITLVCVIMHNIIVEYERDEYASNFPPVYEQLEGYTHRPSFPDMLRNILICVFRWESLSVIGKHIINSKQTW